MRFLPTEQTSCPWIIVHQGVVHQSGRAVTNHRFAAIVQWGLMTRRRLMLAAFAFRRKDMARLPGGTFPMGSERDELLAQFPAAGDGMRSMLMTETPRHEVTIPSFWIDRHEVTNAQFRHFVIARPEWRKERSGGKYLQSW